MHTCTHINTVYIYIYIYIYINPYRENFAVLVFGVNQYLQHVLLSGSRGAALVDNLLEQSAHLLACPVPVSMSRNREVRPEKGNGCAALVEKLVKFSVVCVCVCVCISVYVCMY